MYVQITGGRRVKKLLPPSRKQLTITETNTILQRLETFAEDTGIKDTIRIKLVKDKDVLFRDDCIIGEGISRNLLLVVQHTFTTLYGNTNSTECVELITTIQQELENPKWTEPANDLNKKNQKKEKKSTNIPPERRYVTEVFVTSFSLLESRAKNESKQQEQPQQESNNQIPSSSFNGSANGSFSPQADPFNGGRSIDISDDDLPF